MVCSSFERYPTENQLLYKSGGQNKQGMPLFHPDALLNTAPTRIQPVLFIHTITGTPFSILLFYLSYGFTFLSFLWYTSLTEA